MLPHIVEEVPEQDEVIGDLHRFFFGQFANQESLSVRMEVVDRTVSQRGGGSSFPPDGSLRNEFPFVYAYFVVKICISLEPDISLAAKINS